MNITPFIISKNAEATIALTLNSLVEFDEVILLDTGSADKTMKIARTYSNVKLYQGPFLGFGRSKNEASRLAKNDWVLSIDADEILTSELMETIKNLSPKNNTVYKFRRCNFYREMPIHYSGWGKEYVIRLYNKKITCFREKLVHEYIETEGLHVKLLRGNMNHYSYQSISDFSRKRELYSDLFAMENKGKKVSSPSKAFLHATFDFLNTYIIKRGFLDGYRGLLIAVSNANVSFLKYLKLYEANLERNFTSNTSRELFFNPNMKMINQQHRQHYALELFQQINKLKLEKKEQGKKSMFFLHNEN